jgi:hypothetical protein
MSTLSLGHLSAKQKGHWGVVFDQGGLPYQEECLANIAQMFRASILNLRCGELPRDTDALAVDVDQRVKVALRSAQNQQHKSLCVLLRDFHALNVEQQIVTLTATRALRETPSEIALVTIASGAWNRHRLRAEWPKEVGSPCPDEKCIIHGGALSAGDLQNQLIADSWMTRDTSELNAVLAEALLEVSGGDSFLLSELLSVLRHSGRRLVEFQQCLEDVASSETVLSLMHGRMKSVTERAAKLFAAALQQQGIAANLRDPDIEDLRLAGFIKIERTPDTALAVVSSPLIEKIFRHHRQFLGRQILVDASDRVAPSIAINTYAYRLVLQIETMLRNAMVEILATDDGKTWLTEAEQVKIPDGSAETHAAELQELGRRIVAALYPQIDFGAYNDSGALKTAAEQPDSGSSAKKRKVFVANAAREWRQRMVNGAIVFPYEQALPQFMTVGSLMNVYLKPGRCELLVKQCFSTREQAKAFFEKFIMLRSAIAHSLSVGINAVEDLLTLKRELSCRLGRSPSA